MGFFMRSCINLLLIPILLLGCAGASEILVGQTGENYSKIQAAIDVSMPGDTIKVKSGIYRENVNINKPLSLVGVDSGNGTPLVNGGGSGSVITIAAGNTTFQGFNITGSGHCGCGHAGIRISSSNNLIMSNIIYKNKYGIYIETAGTNNTFVSNDLLNNSISISDSGSNNSWDASAKSSGWRGLLEMISGPRIRGNHYSDYDEVVEGCNDTNKDLICDEPKAIGSSLDSYPSISAMN
ncbi:MAG: Cell surface glycoprotein precursor [Euryarchaeota archaeon ADurb.Bin190]|nr:MAG: Cell surface glycoprotein precursor [Euryarchaeota archaeon ADurb.Bin190]